MLNYFFVYGTLKKGCRNHHLLTHLGIKSCSKAFTRGKLYNLNKENYPALLPGNDIVSGELYEVDSAEETARVLDRLENYDENNRAYSEYIREKIGVSCGGNYDIIAYAYCYNIRETDDFKNNTTYIPSGNWKEIPSFVT